MRVPLSWLTDYVETDPAPEELPRRLTMAGVALLLRALGEGWGGGASAFALEEPCG